MKIQINAYKFFDSYGFAWAFGKKFGNYTPFFLRPVAKVVWRIRGKKPVINIK